MVRLRPTRIIDLVPFGQDGEIVMATPGFTDSKWEEDTAGNLAITRDSDGNLRMGDPNIGAIQIIHVLSYVRSAPFERSYFEFTKFLDGMDENDFGSAQELWDAMSKAVEELEAAPGPLQH